MVGLGNVDNTSDANKPVSTAAQTALDLKANLASPTLTGTPLAPTASAGTNTTQIATTAFVKTAVDNLISSAPGALDTLDELAAALGDDANFASTVTTSLAGKAASSHTHSASAIDSGTLAVARLPNVYSNIQTPSIVTVSGGSTAPYTLPGGVFVYVGDVLRVEISSNTNRWMWAEVTLTSSGGPGAWPILLVEEFFASGGLQTYRLAVQLGTSTSFDVTVATSITFRNGTINGSPQTLYVRGVQRRNY
jgi:hypothetical protein